MISLRKYLYAHVPAAGGGSDAGEEFCHALAALAAALLDGIATHVLLRHHPRLLSYSEQLAALRQTIETEPALDDLRAAGPAVAALLEAHRGTVRDLRDAESAEVQQIVSMLNQTIAALSSGSDRSVSRLRQIEADLKHASALPDIVALKARQSETLRYVREESVRERNQSAGMVAQLSRDAQRAAERMAVARSGIPGRDEAERRLAAMLTRPAPGVLAVFVLDRAEPIRQRFGSAVGERYVFLFLHDLLDLLPSPKQVFRWDANSLMADLETASPADAVRAELRSALATLPAERRLDIGQRLAVFSSHHRWSVIPVLAGTALPDLIGRVEQVVRS